MAMISSSADGDHRDETVLADINITPLVDVMLVLLIIFMITAPLLQQGVEIDLPQASANPLPPEQREPMIITQNGEAKMVVQDIESYEKTQQTLDILKILALGQQQIETGQVVEVSKAIGRMRARRTDPE